MGAEQSYQKADSPTINFNNDIENLQLYLAESDEQSNEPANEYSLDGIDIDKYSLYDLLQKSVSSRNSQTLKNNSDLLDKIKMSLDMYVLYDNYNLKHKVLVTDLSKKLENQNKEIKGKSEEIDTLTFKINDIKSNSKKNSNIKLLLLIGIIILVILIGLICIYIYLKLN
jgi:hypothetical protein